MKTFLLLSLPCLILTSFPIYGETVKCQGNLNNQYQTPIEIIIEKTKETFSTGAPTYMMAKTTFSYQGARQQSSSVVRRFENSDKITYKDMLDSTTFRLEISNGIGRLSLDQRTTFAQIIENLSCQIIGRTVIPASFCPYNVTGRSIVNETLLYSVKTGNYNSSEDMLLECKADANFQDKLGCTALLYVVDPECGRKERSGTQLSSLYESEIISLLLKSGANLENRDPLDGRTVLAKSVEYKSAWTTSSLVDAKANVNVKDSKGNTPLISAVLNHATAQVQALMEGKPDLSLTNNEGKTALQIAEEEKLSEIVDLLKPEFETVTIIMNNNGKCSPSMIHIMKGDTVELELKAGKKMLHFNIPEFDVSMMAMPNTSEKLLFTPDKIGTFPYSCSEHGGSQSVGSIMVM